MAALWIIGGILLLLILLLLLRVGVHLRFGEQLELTPERLLYLLISKPEFKIDYIFIDEAHKMTGRNSRGPFYYKTVDMLAQQKPMPHFIFASPNIPNPEVYLKLVTEAQKGEENAISSTFAPVTQFKFLISQETKSIRIFNDHTQDTIFVCKYGNATMSVVDFMNIMTAFDRNKPLNERKRNHQNGGEVELCQHKLLQADEAGALHSGEVDEGLHDAVGIRQLSTAEGSHQRHQIAACAVFTEVSVVLIAALEVACAVLIPFSVVLTVPLAVVFTAFSAFRAVVLIIFCPCCRVFINCDFAVWETSGAEERLAAP